MCLFIEALCAASDRPSLEVAARSASSGGLRVDIDQPSQWPWAKNRRVRAKISGEGGCACSLLSDDANWDAPVWAMRREVLEALSSTLESLAAQGPKGLIIQALWVGDKATTTVRVSPRELAQLARQSGLGTHTQYVVTSDGLTRA